MPGSCGADSRPESSLASVIMSPAIHRISDLWKCSSGNALPDGLKMVICSVERDLGILGKLLFENFLCSCQHQVSALALGHTAQDHDVVDRVELAILGKSIAQIHANRLVNLFTLFLLVLLLHGFLD